MGEICREIRDNGDFHAGSIWWNRLNRALEEFERLTNPEPRTAGPDAPFVEVVYYITDPRQPRRGPKVGHRQWINVTKWPEQAMITLKAGFVAYAHALLPEFDTVEKFLFTDAAYEALAGRDVPHNHPKWQRARRLGMGEDALQGTREVQGLGAEALDQGGEELAAQWDPFLPPEAEGGGKGKPGMMGGTKGKGRGGGKG